MIQHDIFLLLCRHIQQEQEYLQVLANLQQKRTWKCSAWPLRASNFGMLTSPPYKNNTLQGLSVFCAGFAKGWHRRDGKLVLPECYMTQNPYLPIKTIVFVNLQQPVQ